MVETPVYNLDKEHKFTVGELKALLDYFEDDTEISAYDIRKNLTVKVTGYCNYYDPTSKKGGIAITIDLGDVKEYSKTHDVVLEGVSL